MRPSVASTRVLLQRARDAAVQHDLACARDAVIEAWRIRRSPRLADLADLLGAAAPDGHTSTLAALVTPRVATSHGNLLALAEVDDPRLGRFAIDALVALPFTATTAAAFLEELVATVARLDDRRVLDREAEIRDAVTTRIGRLAVRTALLARLDAVLAGLAPVDEPTPEEAALEAELATRLVPLRKSARSEEALLAEVYANPADDAPRLVYADLLLERGDPRGELIMLQLDRGEGPPSEREQELLKKHGKTWLGPLSPVLSWGRGYAKTTFRRGFVAEADIILSVGKKLAPLRDHRAWATVEELLGTWDLELLLHAPLNALRRIERGLGAEAIAQLAKRTTPLASVTTIRLAASAVSGVDGVALRRVFPALETVQFYVRDEIGGHLDALGRLGVDHIELTHNWVHGELENAREAHARFVAGLVGRVAPFSRLTLGTPYLRGEEEPPVVLRRDADGRFALV